MIWQHLWDARLLLLDLLFASALGVLLLSRVNEARTLWLLRGYLFLVALAWFVQRYAFLPLTSKLVDAVVLACSLALAILWQGELRRLMELLGTGRLGVLFGSNRAESMGAGTASLLAEAAGRLSKARRGGLIVLDLGSDLRPEDFLNPGISLDAQLSVDLLLNLFSTDTPLHDGAVLLKGNRIESAGVILPLSRQGENRYGTRHLAALGLTERFDRCLCVVVSEETGTISLASQGRLERPITSGRLQELLSAALAAATSAKASAKVATKAPAKQEAKPLLTLPPPGTAVAALPGGRSVAKDKPEPRA
ncbi:diadenylate cyclase [Cyanobium sp. Morenito 9A2]|uniref:diadenylate cyclase n=1 Tax=Cyanobium sp. Morenito 9A2 TaxID=2823718 RepID=UPI0020CFCE53|nr:diadenylate cyclase [Cyanobium sp. Morenito 9A2]MCP9849045.1 diadenylate cyclase [Cyanobium sp. Morenito 9A2]